MLKVWMGSAIANKAHGGRAVKQRILCAAVAIGLSAAPAMAEPLRMAQAMLPAHEIATIVRSAGFTPLSPVMRRGEFYVLRAAGRDGREMRLVVGARSGDIRSAVPVVPAAIPGERLGPYERMGPYEAVAPDGYIRPGPPGDDEAEPPIVYEGDRPLRRPLQAIPNAPPRGTRAVVPGADDNVPRSEQQAIMTPERGEHGLLPPPPERFPPRALPPPAKPAAKPAPVKRAASAPPLPKPRPAMSPEAPAAAPAEAPAGAPAPQPAAESKPDPRALPH
jgi:hypothetical protein